MVESRPGPGVRRRACVLRPVSNLSGMSVESLPDRLAYAWSDAMGRLAGAAPGGLHTGRGQAVAAVTGAAVASLNPAFSPRSDPGPADLADLDAMADAVAARGLPWSIIVRAGAAEVAAAVAGKYGLTRRHGLPLMAVAAADAVLSVDEKAAGRVRVVGATGHEVYTATLTAAFGVPEGAFGALMGGDVLDAPGFSGYLVPGTATGFGVQGEGVVGVFNIGVVPERRGEGLGRAVTVRSMADGFAAGAGIAYLHASAAGRPLYESIGFREVECWTMFTA